MPCKKPIKTNPEGTKISPADSNVSAKNPPPKTLLLQFFTINTLESPLHLSHTTPLSLAMVNTCFLSLIFCFLIFINDCFSQTEQAVWRETSSSQQQRLRAKSECRIRSLNALEPTRRVKSEAGYLEFWDAQNEQFDCAGVAAVRHVIQPKGLLLPSFTNAPQLTYILRGTYLLLNLANIFS